MTTHDDVDIHTEDRLLAILEKYPSVLAVAREIAKTPDGVLIDTDHLDMDEVEVETLIHVLGLDALFSYMESPDDYQEALVRYLHLVDYRERSARVLDATPKSDVVGRETKAQLFDMLERYPNLPAVARTIAEIAMVDRPEMDELEVSSLAFELALDADTWMGSAAAAQELVAAYFEAVEYEKELEYRKMFE